MTKTAHTPGKWEADGCNVYSDDAAGSIIAQCGDFRFVARADSECCANARLIAAAPELLAALQVAERELVVERDALYDSITDADGNIMEPDDGEGLHQLDAIIDQCRAAISRATSTGEGEA